MKFDVLVRHIEASDPPSLRELALLCLHARGFSPEVTDGPDDGGRDLRVFVLTGGRRYAVQTSVEKGWRAKMRADALDAKAKLGVTDMLYVSSRRMPEADFVQVQDELAAAGVAVQKMDSQGIASLLQARGLIPRALEILGLWRELPRSTAFERPDLRQEVSWAYAFFGVEPASFREGVLERAIVAVVARAGGSLPVDEVVDRVSLSLGLAPTQRAQVRPAIDRLRASSRVTGQNGTVKVSDSVQREQDALRVMRARARDELRDALADALTPWVKTAPRRANLADQLMADVSALLVDDARVTAKALTHDRRAEAFTEARERTRRLADTLAAFGLDGDDEHRAALVAIADVVRRSTLGRHLVAGEVFVNLLSLRTSQFVAAVAGKRSMRAVLDASVALPLLTGLLFEPVAQRYSVAARHAYEQLLRHGVDVMVPADYVEEMASHLYDAWSYRDLVEAEPDLRASQNAFVSHFVGLGAKVRAAEEPAVDAFERYLGAFGFQESLTRGDFMVARRHLERRLEAALGRYRLRVERLSLGTVVAIDAVRAELSHAAEARQASGDGVPRRPRPEVLLRHDARTLAWLDAIPASAETATVFCTWDRLIFEVHEGSSRLWEALGPAQLGDALMLAAPEASDEATPVSVLDLALSLADEDAERGARVLDQVVRIVRGEGYDAQHMAEARRFKAAWLTASHPRPLEEAWADWKRDHLPSTGEAKKG